MEAELLKTLTGRARLAHERLLHDSGLDAEGDAPMDVFLLLWDGDILAATGARPVNVFSNSASMAAPPCDSLFSTLYRITPALKR